MTAPIATVKRDLFTIDFEHLDGYPIVSLKRTWRDGQELAPPCFGDVEPEELDAIREWAAPGSGAAHLELVGVMLLAWLREWHRMTEWTTWEIELLFDDCEDACRIFDAFDTVDGIPAAEWLKRLRAEGER